VAVRIAELARERHLPIHVTIVSKLEVGRGVWSDQKPGYFDRYLALLDAANVTYFSGLPNAQVLKLLREMDFSLLTTFSDTFGWSVIESVAHGTPAIVTPQGALGEFVVDGQNGIVDPLPINHLTEWTHIHDDLNSAAFDEVERLAHETLMRLKPLIGVKAELLRLRAGARETAERLFNSRLASLL
jgi:glycosyltransferase involved in cell wall biosynthesis